MMPFKDLFWGVISIIALIPLAITLLPYLIFASLLGGVGTIKDAMLRFRLNQLSLC